MRVHQAVTLLLAALAATPAQGNGEVFTLHGSGTTNPSKCFWHIMSLFEERSQISTRLTYRAVGSSTGITEFLGVNNTAVGAHVPHNDFGSGDIPVPSDKYVALNAAVPGATDQSAMVHLPFAISSVSFFHNIPGVPDGEDGIHLSPCTLARIFNGELKKWSDPEILGDNVDNASLQTILEDGDLPIFVARRVQGSSSTASVTQVSIARISFFSTMVMNSSNVKIFLSTVPQRQVPRRLGTGIDRQQAYQLACKHPPLRRKRRNDCLRQRQRWCHRIHGVWTRMV